MASDHTGSIEAEFVKLGESLKEMSPALRAEMTTFLKGVLAGLMMIGGEAHGEPLQG